MRRGEPLRGAFLPPGDVHTCGDGQVYLFRAGAAHPADSSEEEEEEEFSVMELRPRSRESARQERERAGDLLLLERDVSHCDNLNKLALQYGCKVADIKRVNNLIREQDFYALKSIRIPVKKHGLFTECSAELGETPPCASRAPCPLPSPSPSPAAHSTASPDARECTDFLREVDQDLERLIQTSDGLGPCPADDHGGPPRAAGRQGPASYGADWGIRWWNAVLVMLLIGIILPIFYLVYYKTQESGRTAVDAGFVNHSDPTSNTTEKSLGTTPSEGLDVQGRTHPLLRKTMGT